LDRPGAALFDRRLHQAIEIAKLSGRGRTVLQAKGKIHVAEQYRLVTSEIEWRILNRERFLAGEKPPVPVLQEQPREDLQAVANA
jgi:hypothetical protein